MRFSNRRIVVTGGTRGIGAAIGKKFASGGGEVILTGRNVDAFNRLQSSSKYNVKYVQLDLENRESIDEFLLYLESLGNIDVLVNNAGINRINRIENITYDDFETILDVNLKAPFFICQKAAYLMSQKGGKIINIASIWSKITKGGRVAYISSKAGLAGLTRGMATDMAKFNVLVNTVSPGFVLTELTRQSLTDEEMTNMTRIIPMNRMAQPHEIANVVAFLASDENSYITGQNIVVDGGFSNV
jgi:NAD(P)-dependent dehydrogenase (short-subunit alcohol dehydrogenase family)